MKKCVFIVFTMLFILTSSSTFTYASEDIIPISSEIKAPSLPLTYVKDEGDFNLLSTNQILEERFISAWENMETEINLYDLKIPVSEATAITNLYWQILHNNPELFWVGDSFIPYGSGGYLYKFGDISYLYTDPQVIAEKKAALDSATADILLGITDDMTDFEKVMAVHDYMVLNYSYGSSDVMHTIFIMTEKTGVCMGYALTFNHLMHVLGIESTYVSSSSMNHAWNLVKIDGKWYHIDVTFDDPTRNNTNMYSYVRHEYALLSSEGIGNATEPHYDFDLGTVSADCTKYDDAPWRYDAGAMAYCNSKHYRIEENNLVDEDGNIIHEDLDGGDGKWHLTASSYLSGKYSGLTSYGNCLYYNTDTAIYKYDTTTKKKEEILSQTGVCGILSEQNILKYSEYDNSLKNIVYSGEIVLDKITEGPIIGDSIHAGDKIITPVYIEDTTPILVFSKSSESTLMQRINAQGSSYVESDTGDIFFWTEKFKPLIPKRSTE